MTADNFTTSGRVSKSQFVVRAPSDLYAMIEKGDDSRKMLEATVNNLATLQNVEGVTLAIADELSGQLEIMFQAGKSAPNIPFYQTDEAPHTVIVQSFELRAFGRYQGALAFTLAAEFQEPELIHEYVRLLATIMGHVSRTKELREHQDRIEVLNEFTQLVSAGVNLERITKALVRQLAFRFSSDAALLLLFGDAPDHLEVKGRYGVKPEALPERFEIADTLLERAIRLGGIMSMADLSAHSGHGLEILAQSGIAGIHACTLEGKEETMGVLLIGYRSPHYLSDHESALFEEFARGATAALSAALSQAKLASYAERLEELVQRRTQDLANEKAKAEDANRAKSRFVANMSHELRTPLTAIVGYSSVIADGVFGSINDKQRDALLSITRSSQHLKELIDEVLNLARIEAGKEDAEPSSVELGPLLQQIYKLVLQTAVGKGVQLRPLEIKDEDKLAKMWVDPRHVRQILLNIMSNAVKYTPANGTVQLAAEIHGDKVRISVRDTGVGISKEEAEHLFERFERGSDSYSREQVGTGIGLSLTKQLVERNGGRIGVESEKGLGSTFWILMPLAEHNAVSNDMSEEEEGRWRRTRLDGLNILIVDDNKLSCEVLATVLAEAGAQPYIAESAHRARELSEAIDCDAALIDLAMPGESGLSLIEYFRRNRGEPYSTMPLIVVSACVFGTDREQAMMSGATDFIAKPFKPSEIVKAIRNHTTTSVLNSSTRLPAVRLSELT